MPHIFGMASGSDGLELLGMATIRSNAVRRAIRGDTVTVKSFTLCVTALVALGTSSGLWAATQPCPPPTLSEQTGSTASTGCGASSFDADWSSRSNGPGVFYKTTFDHATRAEYLAAAFLAQNADTSDGKPKLQLDTSINLSGRGASRHNWYASEGPNEGGPSWAFSFEGLGAKTVNQRKDEFYIQYSMYADQGWTQFTYGDGDIKTLILLNPSIGQFTHGEVVLTRNGLRGPFVTGFRVTNVASPWSLVWSSPTFVDGDDTYYTFWDGGPQSLNGQTDGTSIDLFERRWGPRRRNSGEDPDYVNVPRYNPGKWYTIEVYVNVVSPNSVLKVWFAEYGQPPRLLAGLMDMGVTPGDNRYRGGNLISRAENTTKWVSSDTFVVFDELIISDDPISYPGGFSLPESGTSSPPNWPPSGSRPRN